MRSNIALIDVREPVECVSGLVALDARVELAADNRRIGRARKCVDAARQYPRHDRADISGDQEARWRARREPRPGSRAVPAACCASSTSPVSRAYPPGKPGRDDRPSVRPPCAPARIRSIFDASAAASSATVAGHSLAGCPRACLPSGALEQDDKIAVVARPSSRYSIALDQSGQAELPIFVGQIVACDLCGGAGVRDRIVAEVKRWMTVSPSASAATCASSEHASVEADVSCFQETPCRTGGSVRRCRAYSRRREWCGRGACRSRRRLCAAGG
jgi:hypothetical protein